VIIYVAAVLSDLIAANRVLLEEIRSRQLRAGIMDALRSSPDSDRA
jgi:hypothetical protein